MTASPSTMLASSFLLRYGGEGVQAFGQDDESCIFSAAVVIFKQTHLEIKNSSI
jgi:hypothetical protein